MNDKNIQTKELLTSISTLINNENKYIYNNIIKCDYVTLTINLKSIKNTCTTVIKPQQLISIFTAIYMLSFSYNPINQW